MAKREFIETREIVYVNAPIAPILQGDSIHYEDIAFKAQIGRIHSFSEQDIVKPYLKKLKEQIVGKSFTEEVFDEHAFNSMYSESVSKDTAECESYIEMTIIKMDDVLRLIDNLLSEQEVKE